MNKDISSRIKHVRESLGLNQSKFSRELGIPRSTLVGYESGSTVPAELLGIISRKYDISVSWLMSETGPMKAERNIPPIGEQKQHSNRRNIPPDTKPKNLPISLNIENGVQVVHGSVPDGLVIPWLDQAVSAGRGQELEDEAYPSRFVTVPPELGRYPSLSALPVRGDSMAPTLHEGDLVVCDSGGWDGDGVYVIRTQEQAFVKRVVQTSKGYTVISDNKAYPSYSESREDVTIVGKVRCAVVKIE